MTSARFVVASATSVPFPRIVTIAFVGTVVGATVKVIVLVEPLPGMVDGFAVAVTPAGTPSIVTITAPL